MSDTCLYPSTLLLSLSSDSTPTSTYSTFNSPYQALLCPLLSSLPVLNLFEKSSRGNTLPLSLSLSSAILVSPLDSSRAGIK